MVTGIAKAVRWIGGLPGMISRLSELELRCTDLDHRCEQLEIEVVRLRARQAYDHKCLKIQINQAYDQALRRQHREKE